MKPEALLAKRVAVYLRTAYPTIPYHFDLGSDMRVSIGVAKRNKDLHSMWSRGHPDLAIYYATKKYAGLFIELKATKTVTNSDHTRRQRAYHDVLRSNGYKAEFCCGFEESKKMIDDYMSLKKKKVK